MRDIDPLSEMILSAVLYASLPSLTGRRTEEARVEPDMT
jgi:hypothetical protein